MLVVEGAPFAVDGHGEFGVQFHVGEFWDVAAFVHVCSVAACAEDAADFDCVVGVGGGDEGSDRVVDESG